MYERSRYPATARGAEPRAIVALGSTELVEGARALLEKRDAAACPLRVSLDFASFLAHGRNA